MTLLLPFCPLVLLWVPRSFLDVSQPSPGWEAEAEGAGVRGVLEPARAGRYPPMSPAKSLFCVPAVSLPRWLRVARADDVRRGAVVNVI